MRTSQMGLAILLACIGCRGTEADATRQANLGVQAIDANTPDARNGPDAQGIDPSVSREVVDSNLAPGVDAMNLDPYDVFVNTYSTGSISIAVIRIQAVSYREDDGLIVSDIGFSTEQLVTGVQPGTAATIPGGVLNGTEMTSDSFPPVEVGQYYLGFFDADVNGQPRPKAFISSDSDGTIAFPADNYSMTVMELKSRIGRVKVEGTLL